MNSKTHPHSPISSRTPQSNTWHREPTAATTSATNGREIKRNSSEEYCMLDGEWQLDDAT